MVCHGSGCGVTFSNCTFTDCSLLVLHGAHATLVSPRFSRTPSTRTGTAVYASGPATVVQLDGGSITGGTFGGCVDEGAHLEASSVTVCAVEVLGVLVQGRKTTAEVSHCTIGDSRRFKSCLVHSGASVGVKVCCGGGAKFTGVTVSGVEQGCEVHSRGKAALQGCTFKDITSNLLDVCGRGSELGVHQGWLQGVCVEGTNACSGVHVSGGGKLVFSDVMKNGVARSGTWVSGTYVCYKEA